MGKEISPAFVNDFLGRFDRDKNYIRNAEQGLVALLGAAFGLYENTVDLHEYEDEDGGNKVTIRITIQGRQSGKAEEIANFLSLAESDEGPTFENIYIDIESYICKRRDGEEA